MVRLTRAQQQERTRAAVLAAAREEFAEHGYVEAKVDRIAERADLTRGAVYSNFPSKRALYLAVLVHMVEDGGAGAGGPGVGPSGRVGAGPGAGVREAPASPSSPADALGAFARVWLERLPLVGDTPPEGNLQLRSLTGMLDDEQARATLAQVTRLEALLLGLALESRVPQHAAQARLVRLAELVLTLLNGAGHLADTAPGFGDPFDVAHACEHLAGLDLADTWDPPHLSFVSPAQPSQDAWAPPNVLDHITGRRIGLDADGVIAVLGTSRLSAAEEPIRAARPGDQVTVAVVTNDPAEFGRVVRLRISDLTACLRRVFVPDALPPLHLVLDDRARVASAIGAPDAGDETEYAVRVREGTIVARAGGRGAAHAAATAGSSESS